MVAALAVASGCGTAPSAAGSRTSTPSQSLGARDDTRRAQVDPAGAFAPITPPPPELVARLRLSPLYVQYMDVGGVPILASRAVNPYALREAHWVVRNMVGHRPEVLAAIASQGIRLVVMAPDEMTTDVPEHSDLAPKAFWDRRARGLGATLARPATSCGEENLLGLRGDPYATENILVHEFGHTLHQHGFARVDPTFQARLSAAFAHARESGRWERTYAATNVDEYWAEATQSWFDTNRNNDNEHGPIDTRDKLKAYDPEIAGLLREAYGDGAWRYQPPSRRAPGERGHLAGFDPAVARTFAWPATSAPDSSPANTLVLVNPAHLPSASPSSNQEVSVTFVNRRRGPVAVEWVGFRGERRRYFVLAPGSSQAQSTYVGHVWVLVDLAASGATLGGVAASASGGAVEVTD
jgi:hypothetical protein